MSLRNSSKFHWLFLIFQNVRHDSNPPERISLWIFFWIFFHHFQCLLTLKKFFSLQIFILGFDFCLSSSFLNPFVKEVSLFTWSFSCSVFFFSISLNSDLKRQPLSNTSRHFNGLWSTENFLRNEKFQWLVWLKKNLSENF